MTRKANSSGAVHWLSLAALVVLVGGLGMPLVGAQEMVEQDEVQSTTEPRGECRCGMKSADGDEPGCRRGARGRGADAMRQGRGRGMSDGMGPKHGGRGGYGAGRPEVMEATRALVHDYRHDIVREVQEIEAGVVTVTRSPNNPEAVAMLQRHVGEMKGLVEEGGRIRVWDPLFSEIFDHYEEIDMVIEPLPDGLRVIETSENPEVAKLIKAHARRVSDFIARGPEAVHEATPLPEDYSASAPEAGGP